MSCPSLGCVRGAGGVKGGVRSPAHGLATSVPSPSKLRPRSTRQSRARDSHTPMATSLPPRFGAMGCGLCARALGQWIGVGSGWRSLHLARASGLPRLSLPHGWSLHLATLANLANLALLEREGERECARASPEVPESRRASALTRLPRLARGSRALCPSTSLPRCLAPSCIPSESNARARKSEFGVRGQGMGPPWDCPPLTRRKAPC